jgi:hypothetical protein
MPMKQVFEQSFGQQEKRGVSIILYIKFKPTGGIDAKQT